MGVAFLATSMAAVAWFSLSVWIGGNYTFGVYSLAVAGSCWYGGIRAGLFCTVFSAALIALLFPVQGSVIVATAGTQLIWFLATSLVICLVLEASERAAREAEDARATLNSLVEVAPIGIALFDNQMRYRLVNNALAEANGIAAADHIGKRVVEILPDFAPVFERHFEHIMQTGQPIPAFEITGPPGERTWLEYWFPVKDSAGTTIGVGAMVQEVTQLRRNEHALKEADRRKDEFLAMLAHELRNPLAPIRNALHILRYDELRPPQAKAVDIIDRQLTHLVRLVDDLLDLARITTGKIELRKRNVELHSIVSAAVDGVRPLIEKKHQALELALPSQKVILHVDGARLSQVLSNLLNNASKFTSENGRICVAAELEGAMLSISVQDNGQGINAELLPHIFDMFAQGPQRFDGGLGIGLSLARRLIEMHGGAIEAKSDGPARGSEFVIRLPATAQNIIERRAAQRHDMPDIQGRRILIVEDNRDSAESLETLLTMLGNEVMAVYDGPSALPALQRFQPDMALIDIGLPGMSGHEVARNIRRLPNGKSLLLVALTGWGQQKDHELSRQAGFDAHLLKPLDLAQLAGLLAKNRQHEAQAGALH